MGTRHYHTFDHAIDVIKAVCKLDEEVGFIDRPAAWIAALFHDAIYVVRNGHGINEARSARAMHHIVGLYDPEVPAPILRHAQNLIMATADHVHTFDNMAASSKEWDCLLFMDADMLGFAAPYEEFVQKNNLVDKEFSEGMHPEQYRLSRKDFLMKLKDRGVFRTPPVRRRYENIARDNIQRALEELGEEK